MKTIFSHLLNVLCIMWQDRIVCSSRLLPQMLLKPLETWFFLHSGLRRLFSQCDWTIFLVRKVMLQILRLGHFTSGLSRDLFILQIAQQNMWMSLLICVFSVVTFKVFVPWETQVIQVSLLNLILRLRVTMAAFRKASLSFQTNVFKLHLHMIDGTRVKLYPPPPENFKNQSCCNFSILLPHWILEMC